jgi:serine/threonine-protein kinase HipA
MADDIEVFVDFAPGLKHVGTLHRQPRRGSEVISFDYHPGWLTEKVRFSLEPGLTLNRGAFVPQGDRVKKSVTMG